MSYASCIFLFEELWNLCISAFIEVSLLFVLCIWNDCIIFYYTNKFALFPLVVGVYFLAIISSARRSILVHTFLCWWMSHIECMCRLLLICRNRIVTVCTCLKFLLNCQVNLAKCVSFYVYINADIVIL